MRPIAAPVVSSLAVALAVACGGTAPPADIPSGATSIRLPPPSRNIQLRAAFDKDPSVYIGRFVPDSVAPGDIDENTGVVTRCSKFIKPKYVETQQDMDESMYVSHRASSALGLPIVASISASTSSRDQVRVKYSLTKKVQSDIDADGLAQCCKADPSQCTKTIIGEFLLGTGDVLQSARDTDKVSASVQTPRPLSASADYKSDDAWKKTTSFKEVYFAFLTEAAPTSLGAAAAGPNDCSWCDALPGSLDGKYFCGISPEVPEESAGRTLALRSAREQVVQYLGQSISVKSTTTSNALAKALDDHEVVRAASEGIASQVKDEKWCKEKIATPDGEKLRTKVLAFYPKSAEDEGRKAVADAAADAGKKSGQMSPLDQKNVRDAAKGAK